MFGTHVNGEWGDAGAAGVGDGYFLYAFRIEFRVLFSISIIRFCISAVDCEVESWLECRVFIIASRHSIFFFFFPFVGRRHREINLMYLCTHCANR